MYSLIVIVTFPVINPLIPKRPDGVVTASAPGPRFAKAIEPWLWLPYTMFVSTFTGFQPFARDFAFPNKFMQSGFSVSASMAREKAAIIHAQSQHVPLAWGEVGGPPSWQYGPGIGSNPLGA